MKSLGTVDDATEVIHKVKGLYSKQGFNLFKFPSNKDEELKYTKNTNVTDTHLVLGHLHEDRALGVKQDVQTGTISFHINLSENASTRSGLLSRLSSIYDPPGLEAPILLKGQLILQQHCGSKLDWDEVTDNSAYE